MARELYCCDRTTGRELRLGSRVSSMLLTARVCRVTAKPAPLSRGEQSRALVQLRHVLFRCGYSGRPPVQFQSLSPGGGRFGPWRYFTSAEGTTIEAMVDRLIPAGSATPGGKNSGCAVFIDRQLAGPYGTDEGLYMSGPFHDGTSSRDCNRRSRRQSSIAGDWPPSMIIVGRRMGASASRSFPTPIKMNFSMVSKTARSA